MSTRSDSVIDIPPAKAAQLYRLARGWAPPSMPSRTLVKLRWGGVELDTFKCRIRVDGDRLLAEHLGADPAAPSGEPLLDTPGDRPISGTCDDGAAFSARGAAIERSIPMETLRSNEQRVVIACRDWSIQRRGSQALLWAGILDGELLAGGGNLSLVAGENHLRRHVRLDGRHYGYYFLRNQQPGDADRWLVAVDPRDAIALDHDLLREEMAGIAVSFGCLFQVSRLHGLDERGLPAGVLGGGFGVRPPARPRVSTPTSESTWTIHAASFFHALSARSEALDPIRKACLRRAVGRFLRALDDPSEEGFALEMLLGSIAAAGLVLGETQTRVESGALIRLALIQVGLAIPEDMDRAIDAAAGWLSGQGAGERLTDEIAAILQTILVALIARTIDYKGPLSRWQTARHARARLPSDPAWWPADSSDKEEGFQILISDAEAPRVARDLWPPFHRDLPHVPVDGPIALLSLFAGALSERTGGLVTARVLPVIRTGDEPAVFDFLLQSIARSSAQTVLFSIEEAPDGRIRITGWGDADPPLLDDAAIEPFLTEVANAEVTRDWVHRLMLVAGPEQP